MLEAHVPLFLMVVLSVGLGTLLLTLSNFLGPRRPNPVKLEPFECGNPPTGPARDRFNVKFYLVAILFLVFDIEAVFVYPWAVVFSDAARGVSAAVAPAALAFSMFTFAALLVVTLAYAWRKGALEWNLREEEEREAHIAEEAKHGAAHGHAPAAARSDTHLHEAPRAA
jgi:NADH-quinone oxidoreductase subunit A